MNEDPKDSPAAAPEPRENVDRLMVGGREVIIIGTAHVSKQSAALAREIILAERPEAVAVELCESRFRSLRDPQRWKNTDIYTVVKEGRAYVLMTQLALAAFQKKLGEHLEAKPGAEMLEAVAAAEEVGAAMVLADRDVKTTLKRTWSSLGFWSMMKVISAMLAGLFTSERLDEKEVERLKSSDALEELMRDFSERLPDVRTALIDERDQYLAAKIAAAPGGKVVAVVGAGHVPGIKRWIHSNVDLAALETMPPPKLMTRVISWGIPLLVVGLIGWGFLSGGSEEGWSKVFTWFWVTSSTAALGSLIALAHPLTILSAFIAAPVTTLHPLLASGWVAGLVEAAIRKPRVSDLETIADDLTTVSGLWRNRVSKVLLVVLLTNLLGSLGAAAAIFLLS